MTSRTLILGRELGPARVWLLAMVVWGWCVVKALLGLTNHG